VLGGIITGGVIEFGGGAVKFDVVGIVGEFLLISLILGGIFDMPLVDFARYFVQKGFIYLEAIRLEYVHIHSIAHIRTQTTSLAWSRLPRLFHSFGILFHGGQEHHESDFLT